MWGRTVRRLMALVGGAHLVACSGSGHGVPGFPLTSRVLEQLHDARPFQLRVDSDQRPVPCVPRDTQPALLAVPCGAVAASVAEGLAELAPRVSMAGRAVPSTDAMWASALLDLAGAPADSRTTDGAIARLREVHEREPGVAHVLNHLAAAYAERASARGDARDLFTALDYIEHGITLDSLSPALRFNRAMLHDMVGTARRAREEWAYVVSTERSEGWRDEARRRAAALPTGDFPPFVRVTPDAIARDPQGAREFSLDSLVPRWARAAELGDTVAMRDQLEQLRMVAAGLLAFRGDSSVVHVVRDLESGAPAAEVLGTSLAIQAYRLTLFDSAARALSSTVPRLRARGAHAVADWGELMLGGARLAQRRYADALHMLEPIASRAAARGDRALRGRTLSAIGVAVGRAGAMDVAERRYAEARATFVDIGEPRLAAAMAAGLADTQGYLGRSMESANSSFLSFVETVRGGALPQYEPLLSVADQLSTDDRPYAALHFLSEATVAARSSPRTKDLPETLARTALVQVALEQEDAALRSIREARQLAASVPDSSMRARLDAEIYRAYARVVAERAPSTARALVDSARMHFAALALDDGPLLNLRGQLGIRLGDLTGATRDIARSIARVSSQSTSASPGDARKLLASLRESQRTLVDLALAEGDTVRAFRESVRLASTSLTAHADPVAISYGPVPAGHAEVRFVVTAGRVLTWVRTDSTRRLSAATLGGTALVGRVRRFVNAAQSAGDSATVRELGRELFQTLLGPHEATLARASTLDLHADGILTDLPFELLTESRGSHVMERFLVRNLVSTGRSSDQPVKRVSAVPLLVGDPSWKRQDHPGLEPLVWANREVQQVAALYPRARVLAGTEATKGALVREMGQHAVIHFAGHSRVVPARPPRSHLVLAGAERFDDGVLTAGEIETLDLRGVRLVVLSSCGQARDGIDTRGEINPLALAFLDAGVETVVAGRWEVDDEQAAQAVVRFHSRELQQPTRDDIPSRLARASNASTQRPVKPLYAGVFAVYSADPQSRIDRR